jgi:hypothetical protein
VSTYITNFLTIIRQKNINTFQENMPFYFPHNKKEPTLLKEANKSLSFHIEHCRKKLI